MKSNRKGAANSRRDEPKLPAAEARAPQPAPQIVNGVRYPGGEVVDTVDTRGTVNGRQILADAAAYDAILAAMRQPPVAHRRAPAPPRPAPPPPGVGPLSSESRGHCAAAGHSGSRHCIRVVLPAS